MKPSIIARLAVLVAVAAAVVVVFRLKEADPAPEPAAQPAADVALPRMLDLGADKCIPCKKMAPILVKLRKDFAGEFEVVFIDVWKDKEAGKPYGVKLIPTQIFFDAEGDELFRHVGFFSRDDILGTWSDLGYEFAASTPPAQIEES
ncbi:MAG: thioredoxin family protein [Planctomycetes bacterium]|nr:thioredoxin family protein [Planctomycetota bacterium]